MSTFPLLLFNTAGKQQQLLHLRRFRDFFASDSRRIFLVGAASAALIWSSCPASGFSQQQASDSICSVATGHGTGYDYIYPSSWVLEKIRGVEVLAHDPDSDKLNLTITTGPAQRVQLGSPEEVGESVLARYKTVPEVRKTELLMISSTDDPSGKRYTLELRVMVKDELRHYLFRILKTEKKVYTMALQIPEERWQDGADCFRNLIDALQITQ